MEKKTSTKRCQHPDYGGQLGQIDVPPPYGWPTRLAPSVGAGWWNRRCFKFGSTYQGVWERYKSTGLVVEVSQEILDRANEEWGKIQVEGGPGLLTVETPWTLLSDNGTRVEFQDKSTADPAPTQDEISYTYGTGWVLHHYWQLDLGKMVRKIRSKLQETNN